MAPVEQGLHASYYHKLNDNQAVGVEIDGKRSTKECVATVGYSFEIPGAETIVKSELLDNDILLLTNDIKLVNHKVYAPASSTFIYIPY